MDTQTIILTIIVALTLFVWLPALITSVRRALRNTRKQNKDNIGDEN